MPSESIFEANGVLPGAEGFSVSRPQPKKYGRLPIRHNTQPTTHGVVELVPHRFRGRVDPVRHQAARNENNHDRSSCSKQEYLKESGIFKDAETEELYLKNSIDPRTGEQTKTSRDEAIGMVQAKLDGVVEEIWRPSNQKVDLDCELRSKMYKNATHGDIKTSPSLGTLKENGIPISGPSTYEKMGASIGTKLIAQKSRFVGEIGGPEGP